MSAPEALRPGAPGELQEDGFLRQGGRTLLLALYTALRSLKLYPLENATVQKALDDLQAAAGALLAQEEVVEVRLSGDFLFVNATRLRLELDNYAYFSHTLSTFRDHDIGVVRVERGVERREWQIFLSLLLSLGAREPGPRRFLELRERLGDGGVAHLQLEPLPESEERLDLEQAKEMAKRTYTQGVAVTKDVINSVRLGRGTSLRRVKRAVQTIVDQVLNNETSIIGLTTIRDYDEYTFTHSVNVCIFAVALGKRLGLTKMQLYDLGTAALLHDVGKARVPVEVLNKTSALDEAEWRLMQSHPWLGALSLFGMRAYEDLPYRAIIVAHEHHMKTDLTGYPKAVRPRRPSLYSRLVAVADGFDAATTRRAYQSVPIEPDQVLREMWANPNRGYDKVLVKALINLIGIYPVGTCVILDTMEVAVVAAVNPDQNFLARPLVRLAIDDTGAPLPVPGKLVNLAETDGRGGFRRSIVKVTNPERYGLVVGDYFV